MPNWLKSCIKLTTKEKRVSKKCTRHLQPDIPRAPPFKGMDITFLGTSSGSPTHKRNVSSLVLHLVTGEQWMFDAGEATQVQIRHCRTASMGRINRIFITHMHGDHIWGLPGLLSSLLIGIEECNQLHLYGPSSLDEWIKSTIRMSRTILPRNKLVFHPLDARQKGHFVIVDDDNYTVHACPIKHTIPCWGYVVEEKKTKGNIDAAKLTLMGIAPGPIYKQIKDQWDQDLIVLSDGIVLDRKSIMSEPKEGRKLVILGDTCDPSNIQEISMDANAIVHECTLPESMAHLSRQRGHSTATMAAKFASKIRAKSLVLNHFSPRFCDDTLRKELDLASRHYKGNIILASDFGIFQVAPNKSKSVG
ncbi:ribonuclease BN-like [Schistocerca gregaria]|uniref:ribonuclease BN-like n=1 Tax=Schistocerca gregaria TaxID=7010 RepID=UPI00211E78C8|nr:ribonuclease BN-like [Schistocerca gregaria]